MDRGASFNILFRILPSSDMELQTQSWLILFARVIAQSTQSVEQKALKSEFVFAPHYPQLRGPNRLHLLPRNQAFATLRRIDPPP